MNLEQLRKQAKDLVKAARDGDADALARLGDLPVRLASAQLAVAREQGFAGWPALGAEIDGRTLPQEVRYDEIGGVSYTKGCYVGQETVARLHFRGHANRHLRGLLWRTTAPLADERILTGEREVGTVRSTLALDDRRIGLGLLRREIDPGAGVVAGGQRATVLALPFAPDDLA